MDFKIQWRRENRAADPAAVIKIKKSSQGAARTP